MTRRVVCECTALFLALLVAGTLGAQAKDSLLAADDLQYLGAFRLPDTDPKLASRFPYGGEVMAFNPAGDGGKGSLFIAGHSHHQLIAEVALPEPIKDRDVKKLPTAELLQPFADVTGGLKGSFGDRQMRLGGLHVHEGKILWSVFKWYNVDGENLPSHGVSELNLKEPNARGPWRIGAFHSQKTAGFMCTIPEPWQKKFGFTLLTGQSRMQGRATSSEGPAAFGFALSEKKAPARESALSAKPFLAHGLKTPAQYKVDGKVHKWKGANSVAGLAFPVGEDMRRAAVVFFVRLGLHPTDWYGEPKEFPGPGSVCAGGRGFHAPPYKAMAWFYDPSKLAASRGAPIAPYAMKDVSGDCFNSCVSIAAVAHDPARRRVFVIEQDADPKNEFESWPVVHVYSIH